MNSAKKCRYCHNDYTVDGREHVFPKGMGGQDIFMDNVCAECNKKFSDYERVMMRDSPIAFMRSVEGVEGYRRSKIPKGAFLAPILLSFDEQKKVVYEVGQRYPFENFVRSQIILIQDTFYIEGDKREHLQNLVDKFALWKREVKQVVVKKWLNDIEAIQWMEFVENDSMFGVVDKPTDSKGKNAIKVDILSETHNLFIHLSPRIYLSDLGDLRIRARSIEEAIVFLIKLIEYTSVAVALNSYPKDTFTHPIIYVGQNFNNLQFSQGLIKIGINCLMYYYPVCRDDMALNECISFVMTGKAGTEIIGEEKNNIKDFGEGTHNLFFQQMTYGMNIRISFFNGAGGAFSFNVVGLMAIAAGEYNRLVIDYKNRTMQFQDRREFLLSFDKKQV